MKHHVVLLTDSLAIPGTYITEEWNIGNSNDNEIPFPSISGDWGAWQKLTMQELKDDLCHFGFIKREFCPPANPDSIPCDPELLNEIGGSASLVEIVLAGTAIISMFFFKANGLPKYQKVFELQLPEE